MNKILTLLLFVVTAFTLVACSEGETTAEDRSEEAPAGQETVESDEESGNTMSGATEPVVD